MQVAFLGGFHMIPHILPGDHQLHLRHLIPAGVEGDVLQQVLKHRVQAPGAQVLPASFMLQAASAMASRASSSKREAHLVHRQQG